MMLTQTGKLPTVPSPQKAACSTGITRLSRTRTGPFPCIFALIIKGGGIASLSAVGTGIGNALQPDVDEYLFGFWPVAQWRCIFATEPGIKKRSYSTSDARPTSAIKPKVDRFLSLNTQFIPRLRNGHQSFQTQGFIPYLSSIMGIVEIDDSPNGNGLQLAGMGNMHAASAIL